uniref:Uncharacterized protein n=1 Tax=Glossina austeni TaxID=7395 RepID=A0A1A9VD28_GLOAU
MASILERIPCLPRISIFRGLFLESDSKITLSVLHWKGSSGDQRRYSFQVLRRHASTTICGDEWALFISFPCRRATVDVFGFGFLGLGFETMAVWSLLHHPCVTIMRGLISSDDQHTHLTEGKHVCKGGSRLTRGTFPTTTVYSI